MGAGIHLRRSLREHRGDGAEATAAVEVFLHGSRHDEALDAVDDAVGADDVVGAEDGGGVDGLVAGGVSDQVEVVDGGEGGVADGGGGGPGGGGDAGGENVGHEEGLEGVEVAGFEEEALELGVEVAFESVVFGGEDGDVVVADGFLELLEEEGLLDELGEFGVVGIQEGNEDGVGVDLTSG